MHVWVGDGCVFATVGVKTKNLHLPSDIRLKWNVHSVLLRLQPSVQYTKFGAAGFSSCV